MRFLGSLAAVLKTAFKTALASVWVLVDEAGKSVWRLVAQPSEAPQFPWPEMPEAEPATAEAMSEAERVQAWARARAAGQQERLPDGLQPMTMTWLLRLGPVELERVATASREAVAHHLDGRTMVDGLQVQSVHVAAVDAAIAASKRKADRPRPVDTAAIEARVLAGRGGQRYGSRGEYGDDEPELDVAPAMAFS